MPQDDLLTVVLTHFKRPHNMAHILEALDNQTLPHTRFVWDNSPNNHFPNEGADWIVRSTVNMVCYPRWWMAANADTKWVLVMDDDLIPRDVDLLADTVDCLEEFHPKPVGAYGVVFHQYCDYHRSKHYGERRGITTDLEVSCLKGRYLACATEKLVKLPAKVMDAEDDIAVNSILGPGMLPFKLYGRLMDLPTGIEALHRRVDHWERRESARKRFLNGR